jgi:hypothetical protein
MKQRGLLFVFLVLSAPAGALNLNEFKTKLNELAKPAESNPATPAGSGLAQFSTQYQIESLRQALTQGAVTSVSSLAREDSFLGNDRVHIPLPEAKTLLVGVIKKMTVNDAKGILTGCDDAATRYFRSNTETALTGKFMPIVGKAMQEMKLSEIYDPFAGKGAKFGLVDERDAKLDDYIRHKAMDGLFLMMAGQEKAIRADPLQTTGNLAKKIFAAIKL